MRQILYLSSSLIGQDPKAFDQLLAQSRNNNGLYGITGLLWSDGSRFAQILEGHPEVLDELMSRIQVDPRHKDVDIIKDVEVEKRHFGHWSMMQPSANSEGDRLVSLAVEVATRARSPLSRAFVETVKRSIAKRFSV